MFFYSFFAYSDNYIYQDRKLTFIINMTNLPEKFFLERIRRVICFEGEIISEYYSDFKINYNEYDDESYFIMEIENVNLLSNKYLFSFTGGYIILFIENNEICDIVVSFY